MSALCAKFRHKRSERKRAKKHSHCRTLTAAHTHGEMQTFPVVMADVDHKGNLMTQFVHEFSRAVRMRAQVQVRRPGLFSWR
jgi:hypothetical protein